MPTGEEIYKKLIVRQDERYPNTNQTKNCWKNYVNYHRCRDEKGEDYEPCELFKQYFNNYCPTHWLERWEELKEKGASQILAQPTKHKGHDH